MTSRVWMVALMVIAMSLQCRDDSMRAPGPPAGTPPSVTGEGRPRVVLPRAGEDGRREVIVELATDDATRAQGLMFRESLAPDRGMLFLFPKTGDYPFWMKDTRIPLDIIWIGEDLRVVHVENDVPPCSFDPCPNYHPGHPARYVLELAAGQAASRGVLKGELVEIVGAGGAVVR